MMAAKIAPFVLSRTQKLFRECLIVTNNMRDCVGANKLQTNLNLNLISCNWMQQTFME